MISSIEAGEPAALEELLAQHRAYIRKVAELRMEDELRSRVDPSDIVQEVSMVVTQRIHEFLTKKPVSFRIWLRGQTLDQITRARRHHLAGKRSVKKEFQINDASSMSIAQQLLVGRPSQIAERKELAQQVRLAIDSLATIDREILVLRHIEELSTEEAADVLGVEPAIARKRHGRAIRRLAIRLAEFGISIDT
jgi:RNA polymerase sigma-70 factor (ECF subfamily)